MSTLARITASKKLFPFAFAVLIVFWISPNASGQGYSLKVVGATFQVDSKKISGYSTTFGNPYKEVKKKWWHYVNARASILNKKTHYELIIPAKKKGTNAPLKLASQLIKIDQSRLSILKIGVIPDEVSNTQLKAFDLQLRNMLKDFKIEYFTQGIQREISEKEKVAQRTSGKMNKYYLHNSKLNIWIEKKPKERDKFVEKIEANQTKIEKLRAELSNIDKEMSHLKQKLTRIK